MRAAVIREEHLINGRTAQESFFGSTVGEKAAPYCRSSDGIKKEHRQFDALTPPTAELPRE